ncbi:RDD family protein [Achromobacter seleniivolatilans]|uniref:RDD family protein n=1 Tax=Achromobacter seleniivolatilans TaxID=3047478 RepID=A0ABY9LTW8_9BURK|nr:RDD family protein [Achromobacter sp. R39]WMD18209.1 RDD family protein [Achromobacter sp. R39]
MQCPSCNWQNPASNTLCFSCRKPLPVKTVAPAAAVAKSAAPAQNAPVFPSIWPRLGATAVDGLFMVVAIIALIWATSLTYQGLTGESCPVWLQLLAGLIGWLLPAFMDAWTDGSPGKRLLKMRVLNSKAKAPGLTRSIWRHTLKYTLNLAVPGLFHHIQQAIFGERAMHNALAGTHVVSSQANPRAVQSALAKARAVTGTGKFLFFVFGVLALILGGVVIGVGIMSKDSNDNPLHADVVRFDLVSDPIRMLVENHYRSTKAYPATMADIGLTQESLQNSGFSKLEMNPVNGVLRLTIAGAPRDDGFPTLAGKHLMYLPELRSEKKGGGIRRWQCGSDDIPRDDRPYSCRHDTSAFAR